MPVYLSSIVGASSIGVYSIATDNFVIIPKMVPIEKAEQMAHWLKVPLVHTSICGSVLAGAFVAANSNGMVLPSFIREEELSAIKAVFKGNIAIMDTKKTAFGNLVLANDRGAIIDPRFKAPQIEKISQALGVEVVPTEIAGLPYVGSLAVATNKGVLSHPLVKEEEKKTLQSVFKVPLDVGTVNCGIPYVGTGLIANSRAAIAGSMTTGPETFIIGNALDVVQEDE